MNHAFKVLLVLLLTSCHVTRSYISSDSGAFLDYGSPNIKQELKNNFEFVITEYADDESYGYSDCNPVMVGGMKEGPLNERRFLNALTGPNGEELKYKRLGSCCHFSTKNSSYGGGMLDKYELSYQGLKGTLIVYINMYDSDTLKVPVGLELKK